MDQLRGRRIDLRRCLLPGLVVIRSFALQASEVGVHSRGQSHAPHMVCSSPGTLTRRGDRRMRAGANRACLRPGCPVMPRATRAVSANHSVHGRLLRSGLGSISQRRDSPTLSNRRFDNGWARVVAQTERHHRARKWENHQHVGPCHANRGAADGGANRHRRDQAALQPDISRMGGRSRLCGVLNHVGCFRGPDY